MSGRLTTYGENYGKWVVVNESTSSGQLKLLVEYKVDLDYLVTSTNIYSIKKLKRIGYPPNENICFLVPQPPTKRNFVLFCPDY